MGGGDTRQIAANVLRPGDRLPSVRQTCKARHLSPSTVFQAYYLLESRGVIRAVPRSGYFVNPPSSEPAPEPVTSTPPEGAHHVEITDLVYGILSSAKFRNIVSTRLGFSQPVAVSSRRPTASAVIQRAQARCVEHARRPAAGQRAGCGARSLKRYLVQGLEVGLDEIVLTQGAMDALNLCLEAVTRPGDAVVVERSLLLRRAASARTAGAQGHRGANAAT
ncbi:MAG: GntR family transcriptional regulator [Aliidongia sp.]